jgi:hypothetical protein
VVGDVLKLVSGDLLIEIRCTPIAFDHEIHPGPEAVKIRCQRESAEVRKVLPPLHGRFHLADARREERWVEDPRTCVSDQGYPSVQFGQIFAFLLIEEADEGGR